MFTVIPSMLRPLTPTEEWPPAGLSASEGRLSIVAGDIGLQIALTPYDAAVIGGQLVLFALANADLDATPAAGEG